MPIRTQSKTEPDFYRELIALDAIVPDSERIAKEKISDLRAKYGEKMAQIASETPSHAS